jgi:uncharacterized membrane protein
MNLPTLQIPLSRFAGLIIGILGLFFESIAIASLPRTIRAYGVVSLTTGIGLMAVVISSLVLFFSVGIGYRKGWSRSGLVYSLVALIIFLLIAVIHTIVQRHMGVAAIAKNVAIFLGLAGTIIIAILFLLNKPLTEELYRPKSLPNQSTLPTPVGVPPGAGAPPAGAAGL